MFEVKVNVHKTLHVMISVVTPHSDMVRYQHFGRSCSLHLLFFWKRL